MNPVFRSYPSHPWLAGWPLEPRGCGIAYRQRHGGLFFHTLDTVGRIAPDTEVPEWSLQIPMPQNSRINLLFNGFCGYFEKRRHRLAAEVLVPEPGVLWGRCTQIPSPVLMSDAVPEQSDDTTWLDCAPSPVLLMIRDDTFCLVTRARIRNEAAAKADAWLAHDFEACLAEELKRRAGAVGLFEQMNRHDALTVISVEQLMRALRPAEGGIPGLWSQSPGTETPRFETNDLFPLALAWRQIDIEVAEQLVRTTLRIQTNSGAIPTVCAPGQPFSVLEAPKPLVARAAEAVWSVRKDPALADELVQPLRRHLQWMLHHFDPKRRGLHCWQNSSEPLTPEIYESDLATADLTVLLLTEVEALHRLQAAATRFSEQPPFFDSERSNLEENLLTQFWDDREGQFSNAVLRGRITKVRGFPAFMPLLWSRLPITRQHRVIDPVKASGNLPGGVSLLSWRKSALDDDSFPLLQQLLVLEALKVADPHGALITGFSRLVVQGFIEWHALSVGEYHTLRMDPLIAGFIINLQETRHGVPQGDGGRVYSTARKAVRRLRADWLDISIVAASILAVVMVHVIYEQLRRPPAFTTLEAQMNGAYANKDAERVLKNGEAIITYYPDQALMARLMTGNILMIQHRYAEAAQRLSEVRAASPDSPGPMIALGLAWQLQGNFEEAEKNYSEFIYLFGDIFPELADILRKNSLLMSEGFRSPPNWAEIYRYQLMHEL